MLAGGTVSTAAREAAGFRVALSEMRWEHSGSRRLCMDNPLKMNEAGRNKRVSTGQSESGSN